MRPARGDFDQFLMQPGGTGTVQAQPADQHDTRHGVVGLGETGPAQILVDEPLRREAPEEPLHHAMLQVQVYNILIHPAGVFKHDRPNRRFPPPVPELLVAPPRRT